MAILNQAQRVKSETLPGGRYPIPDKGHARAALARINQGGLSPSQKAKVRAKAHKVLGKPSKKNYSPNTVNTASQMKGGNTNG